MLTIGKLHDITFKVSVMGTSTAPTVRLVLGTHPEISFLAKHVEGDHWMAPITIPTSVEAGEYDIRVEAIINHRVFTPLTKRVVIEREEVVDNSPKQEPLSQVAEPATTAPVSHDAPVAVTAEQETPNLKPQIVDDKKSEPSKLFTEKEVKERAHREALGMLRKMAEATPKRTVYTPLPKPSSVKVEPIKIDLASINSMVGDSTPVAPFPVKKTRKVMEIKHELPVRLVKGAVVLE